MRRSRPAAVALVVLVALLGSLLAACTSLPTSGPIVRSDSAAGDEESRASDIDPRPPAPGSSPSEVVTGFLEAMTAWPVSTGVARRYLADESADAWKPETETIVYGDLGGVRTAANAVQVDLSGADVLDGAGGWHGELPPERRTVTFELTVEDDEYRIIDPPDALIVPASWFQQRYEQVSLYFFDPQARILVPEPVFVPAGQQLATSLVAGLLAGPPPLARGAVRSFIPPDLSVGLSVSVDDEGVASIRLVGDAPKLTAQESPLMLAQLAWTLRQDPEVRALRVAIGQEDLVMPGGAVRYPVTGGDAFDPAGQGSTARMFGVAAGRVVAGDPDALEPVPGAFGEPTAGIESVAASPEGDSLAVVDDGGRRVRVGPARAGVPRDVRTVLRGGRYARPTWDAAGRMWVLERRAAGGARVWVLDGEVPREVVVPRVTGLDATRLVVSRDGTRLVAIVATPAGDEVVGARVVRGPDGGLVDVRLPYSIRPADGSRITDLAWSGPMQLAILAPTVPGRLQEVDTLAADGASVAVEGLSTVVAGQVIGVAAAPGAGTPALAVLADRGFDVVRSEDVPFAGAGPLTDLDYAG